MYVDGTGWYYSSSHWYSILHLYSDSVVRLLLVKGNRRDVLHPLFLQPLPHEVMILGPDASPVLDLEDLRAGAHHQQQRAPIVIVELISERRWREGKRTQNKRAQHVARTRTRNSRIDLREQREVILDYRLCRHSAGRFRILRLTAATSVESLHCTLIGSSQSEYAWLSSHLRLPALATEPINTAFATSLTARRRTT